MLLQFNFKNFKSFRDETTLDLSSTKITEFSDSVVKLGGESVLPVAAIFGANASGKSNVMEALKFMTMYVLRSLEFGDEVSERTVKPTPFLFDSNSASAQSMFEVYFIGKDEKTYNYGFVLGKNGVEEEWLNVILKSTKEPKSVFYRNANELDLSGLPKKNSENIRVSLERETLVVSLGAKLKISKLKNVRDWFLSIGIIDFGEPIENLVRSRAVPHGFADEPKVREQVVKYLSAFDDSIIGFNVEAVGKDKDSGSTILKIETVHEAVNSDKTVSIPLMQESAGTLKMFSLYPFLHAVLENGGVLVVDELNARLHPLLVRSFIITFLDSEINTNHAQLIFTTHDSWQMSGNLLRRDEIWFTEKNSKGISTLYSLVDFVDADGIRIRKDENYEKNYLLGKYGAIPSVKSFGECDNEKR